MNVQELKAKWKARQINVGDEFTFEGAVIKYHQQYSGESQYGPWCFDAVDFGDSQEWVRVSFVDLFDQNHLLQNIIGQPRSFTAKVDKNKKDPTQLSVVINNALEQLTGPLAAPEVQVNADMPTEIIPPAYQPVAQPAATTHPPIAAAPGSAKDLCQLLADLHFEIGKKLMAQYDNADLEVEILKEAGTSARTLFIELAKKGQLDAAAKEFDLPL